MNEHTDITPSGTDCAVAEPEEKTAVSEKPEVIDQDDQRQVLVLIILESPEFAIVVRLPSFD